ncbi:MAG: PilT/PilU family type 4a pilus ATPase [Acidobacteria bacterium]|nr:PilT/PilU family type 4a pilus ATPase [Acidobacteriota bacterium]
MSEAAQQPGRANAYNLDDLLRFMVKQEASDLHLKPMRPPLLRLKGKLIPLKGSPIKPDEMDRLLRGLLSERQKELIEERRCVEFGYSVAALSRFRGTIFYQRGTLGAVFRRVPFAFPTLDEWRMPDQLKQLSELRQGLVLITGPTGSGKSSTLAAIMQQIVQNRLVHVVTIEDPIEFLLTDALGAVTQREVGSDTNCFADALRNALRQDPDVIMVGENRDLATMSVTLTAAETGHLVMTTLHTNNAPQTIDRIIDMFPAEQHRQVRQQLSQVLRAVISLQLVERADGQGLVASVEILRDSPRIARLIKEGAIQELGEEVEKSVAYYGMQSMNQSLAALVINGTITKETAIENSQNPGDLDLMLRKFYFAAAGRTDVPGEEGDMPSDADYSRINKLLEIERLYNELQESFKIEISDREERIARLQMELQARQSANVGVEDRVARADEERERIVRVAEQQRAEYESKIERLQARIRELTTESSPTQPGGRSGFFRR